MGRLAPVRKAFASSKVGKAWTVRGCVSQRSVAMGRARRAEGEEEGEDWGRPGSLHTAPLYPVIWAKQSRHSWYTPGW